MGAIMDAIGTSAKAEMAADKADNKTSGFKEAWKAELEKDKQEARDFVAGVKNVKDNITAGKQARAEVKSEMKNEEAQGGSLNKLKSDISRAEDGLSPAGYKERVAERRQAIRDKMRQG